MMKKFFVPACAFGLVLTADVFAATCQDIDNGYNPVPHASVLNNRRIHAQATTQKDPFALKEDPNTTILEVWDEDHCAGSKLFKVGDLNPPPGKEDVDPRKEIGTWRAAGTGPFGTGPEIEYDYSLIGDTSYTWKLYQHSGNSGLFPNPGDKYCWEDIATGEAIATGTVEQIVDCTAL